MAITFFGVATTPADNSAQAGPTVTLTPPGSMVDGDLVIVTVRYRDSAATIADTPSNAGGQTWNLTTQYNTTNIRARVFWCRYNGSWSANPAFTVTSGTNNMDAQMVVFRPTSAAYTWSLESGPNGATYTAPAGAVTITGRDTTAASTVSVALWHSVDDNSWGTLSGSGWSKTSLGAQYRNNSSQDNSSTIAYNIVTSPSTIANVSQNQTALGGDAGSTALFTFAETLVTATPSGVSSTASAGSLGIAQTTVGIAGVSSTGSAGTVTVGAVDGGGGSSASPVPDGVAATASAGSVVVGLSQVAEPVGVGIGAAVGVLLESSANVPIGASATASAGTASAVGASAGIVPISGVASSAAAGSLGISTPVSGIAGVSSAASVGAVSVSGGGVILGAGQPSSVFATASAGSIAVAITQSLVGVAASAIADELLSTSITEEIDGNQAAGSTSSVVPLIASPISGVSATASAGTLAFMANAVVAPSGVQSIATVGNLAGITAGNVSGTPEGVEASAQAGELTVSWTYELVLTGVESAAAVGTVVVEGGDSAGEEVFPSGVFATAQVGALSTGEALASIPSVQITAQVGAISVFGAGAVPLDEPEEIRVVPVLEATIRIEADLETTIRITPVS